MCKNGIKSGDYVLVKDHGQEWSNWSYIYIGPHPHGKGHYVITNGTETCVVLLFDEVKLAPPPHIEHDQIIWVWGDEPKNAVIRYFKEWGKEGPICYTFGHSSVVGKDKTVWKHYSLTDPNKKRS